MALGGPCNRTPWGDEDHTGRLNTKTTIYKDMRLWRNKLASCTFPVGLKTGLLHTITDVPYLVVLYKNPLYVFPFYTLIISLA